MTVKHVRIFVLALLGLAGFLLAAGPVAAQDKTTRDLVYEEDDQGGSGPRYSLDEAADLLREARDLYKKEKYLEAVQIYERTLPSAIALGGADNPAVIEAQMYLGDCYQETGRSRQAVDLLAPVVEERVKPLGDKKYQVFHCVGIMALAKAQNDLGDPEAAVANIELVLEPLKRLEGLKSRRLLEAFKVVAQASAIAEEYEEAAAVYGQVWQVEKKIYGSTDPEPVATSLLLASALISAGQSDQALKVYQDNEKALKSSKAKPLSKILNASAYCSTLLKLGRNAEAAEKGQAALDILEKMGLSDSPTAGLIQADVASARALMGQAAPAGETAGDHLRKSGLKDRASLGRALEQVSRYRSAQQYDEALELMAEVLPATEALLGEDSREAVSARYTQALLWTALGEWDKAQAMSEKNLAIAEKTFGPDDSQVLLICHNLVGVHNNRPDENFAEATKYARRIAESYRRTKGPDHRETILAELDCAMMLFNNHDFQKAEAEYQRLLPRAEKVLGEDDIDYLWAVMNYGVLYHDWGKSERSAEILEALLPDLKASGNEQEYMTAADHLGRALLGAGQLEKAAFYAGQAVETGQRIRQQLLRAPLETRKAFAAALTPIYQGLADVLMKQNKIAEAQRVMSLLKIDELADMVPTASGAAASAKGGQKAAAAPAAGGALLAGVDPEVADRYREINDQLVALGQEQQKLLEKRRNGKALTAKEEARLKELRQDMTAARKVFASFTDNLSTELAKSGGSGADLANLETYQRMLETMGDGTVLIQTILTPDRLWLILTTSTAIVAKESPLDVKKLPKMVEDFRGVLKDDANDARPLAREFYQAIIGPLAESLKQAGAKTIMFSLDGQLRYIPMATLYDGQRWLVQDYAVALFNDATKAALAVPQSGDWKVAGLGVSKSHKIKGLGTFPALTAVEGELSSIVKTSGSKGILPGTMTMDEGFTSDRLAEALESGYTVVHVASHFHFDAKDPENSFLLLGDGSGLSLTRIETEDFKFKNVDLLALSACQTARGGPDATGKEIEGFGALAQRRGAKAVLATLWPVFDDSTGLLMSTFYRIHADGKAKPTIAQSLRQAQLMMIDNQVKGEDFRHPFFWGPFVLMGDWR